MKSFFFSSQGIGRWDEDFTKSIHESLPYYVEGFRRANFSHDGVEIFFESSRISDEEQRAKVKELIFSIAKSFRSIKSKKIKSNNPIREIEALDPYPDLLEKGDIKATGRGKFVYAGDVARVFEAIDSKVLEFCQSIGARSELYPTTVQTKTLLRSGYLEMHPQFAYFVAPAHLDQESLISIGDENILSIEHREQTTAHLSVPDQILSPTVCYHTFEARQGTKMAPSIVTALNKCHRHEPVNVTSLERLTTYWMREIVIFGSSDMVLDTLNAASEWSCKFIESLGLGYDLITASDPFFADRGASNRLMQSALSLKQEIKMPLFSGKSTAIASFNNHGSSLVDKFDISGDLERGEKLNSGCVGWGYDRLIYAVFCGLGSNVSDWDATSKRILGLR